MSPAPMRPERQRLIRSLFDEYIEMYASRDDRLTARFSEQFSGYTGSGGFLVKDTSEWVKITRQDFAQVKERIGIEMLDLSMQDLSNDVVVVTALFHIHLPVPDSFLSQKEVRLVLIFRLEGEDWMIVHSGISVPYSVAHDGEVYPMTELQARNRELEALVDERTHALEALNNKLEVLSNTDGLTGIANRRHFDRMLAQEWERGQRAGRPLALVMLDIDDFKLFNDQYGHLAGDACLQTLAVTLAQTVGRRAGELVARYGGEEFAVLLPDTNEHDAIELAERIRHALRDRALPHEGASFGIVTISLGVASLVPSRHGTAQDLVGQADSALYRAKQAGRNCVKSAGD